MCPKLDLDHPNLLQTPKSRQARGVYEADTESSALLGGPAPHRWNPRCWVDEGYWVSF